MGVIAGALPRSSLTMMPVGPRQGAPSVSTKHFVRIGVACMLLAGCKPPQPTYLAQPEVIQAQGAYVHGPSGMTFPTTVGDFQRASITRYDAAGQDMGAGYNLLAPGWAVAATVYVYPAPSLISIGSPSDVVASARATLCKTEFERRKGGADRGASWSAADRRKGCSASARWATAPRQNGRIRV